MKIIYPVGTTTARDKTAFLYRLQEKLRLLHNATGVKYKDGTITKEQWQTFFDSWEDKNNTVAREICKARDGLKKDNSWNVIIDDVIKEE